MSAYRILTTAPKYIFNQFTYNYKLATTIHAYNAVKMPLNEAFNTALQTNVKTAKLLLSSGKLDLNYKDTDENSLLMNILKSQNTSLLKKYFNKVEEAGAKLEHSSISEAFNIALNNKKVVSILLKGLTKLNKLDQLQTQSSNSNSLDKTEEVSAFDEAPPAYDDVAIQDSSPLYPILGKEMFQVNAE